MKAAFTVTRFATFADCDPAGLVFFPRFFTFAHDAVEGLARELAIWQDWFAHSDCACPIVAARSEFLSPVALGEQIKVHAKIEKLGTSSIEFQFEIFNLASGKVAAKLVTNHVFVSKATSSSCPIPTKIRQALEK